MSANPQSRRSSAHSAASDASRQHHAETLRSTYDMYVKYHHTPSVQTEAMGQKLRVSSHHSQFPVFRNVEKTGVIYATSRASEHGFTATDPAWANMGQGAPETGYIEGGPKRTFELSIDPDDVEYAPNVGIRELRDKVATYYNTLYRKDMESQYTADNVCIVPGGRAGLTRIMAILAQCQVGFFSPDYTAYEQALGLFQRITPSVFLHRDVNAPTMSPEEFQFEAVGRGIGAVLLSNPANPTGQSIEGDALREYVDIARKHEVALIMDEFYSHYSSAGPDRSDDVDDETDWPKTVSSAAYIDDVNRDPILIVNGLTKNWRAPGFRCCWVVAPAPIVEMLGSAGSFLDGGANAPLQQLALPLMDLDFIRRDAWALQAHFKKKRDDLLAELASLGITVQFQPTATFYIWADLSNLPPPLNDCLVFLEECVKNKIIIVPGLFFDCNPRSVRHVQRSKCISNVRFSYGPTFDNLRVGMANMRAMIERFQRSGEPLTASTYITRELSKELSRHQSMEEDELKEEAF